MGSREEFVRAVEDGDQDKFLHLISQHANKKEVFDIEEVLTELSKKQLEEMWSTLQMRCNDTLLSFSPEDKDDEAQEKELRFSAQMLDAIVTVAMCTLSLKDVEAPQQLFETIVVLHGILLSLPEEEDKVKNHIARLCEAWWQGEREGREDLAPQTFMYLLQRSLDTSATGADVKRVYKLKQCLEHINLESESSKTLCNLLQHTFISHYYLKVEEGKRFLAYLFSLNLSFIDTIHRTIKNYIPNANASTLSTYGELYFRAWKHASGQFLEKLEQSCIQDLMYHAVHAHRGSSRSLSSLLRKVLSSIHGQKMHRGVDEMLLRLYEPIIWRSLKVANADVRANAATLLVDAFPLQNPEAPNEEKDVIMQKQFDVFSSLLYDPSHTVRAIMITGVCQACTTYWEMIPPPTIKALILHLIQDLAWDCAAADVRVSVLKGLSKMLDQPLALPLMKVILPELRNLVHDTSEKVRVALLDLLLKVKGLRAIKFWSVVPMEHLLARLELDDVSVTKRIVSLLYNSYLPVDKPLEVQVHRCMTMIQTNPGAARKFYQHAPNHLGLEQTVVFIIALCKTMQATMRESQSNNSTLEESQAPESEPPKPSRKGGKKGRKKKQDKENFEKDCLESSVEESNASREADQTIEKDASQQESSQTQESEESGLSLDDIDMIAGVLETVLILWFSISPQLTKEGNKELKRKIQARLSHMLPPMIRHFHDERILSSLIMLSGLLPPNTIPVVSRSLLSKLKSLDETSDIGTYGAMLESMCQWDKTGDVLELINDWLEAAFKVPGVTMTPSGKTRRKSKTVGFVDPVQPKPVLGLQYLTYLTQHTTCRDLMLRNHRKSAEEVAQTLTSVLRCLEKRFISPEPLSELATDDFLTQAFEAYCRLEVVLHQPENVDHNAVSAYNDLITWADVEVLRLLKRRPSSHRRAGKKLMGQADATLLSNPSGDETLLQQTIANQTMVTATETLLNDTLLSTTGVKRSAGDGQAGVISQIAATCLQAMVKVASNMLLVGVGDQRLASNLADFSIQLLQVDESSQFLQLIAGLMYQITEMTLSLDVEEGVDSDIVPNMLTKVVTMIAQMCRHKKEQAQRVLPTIRLAFTEILTSYYRHQSLDDTAGRDVMSAVTTAVLNEMTRAVGKDAHFEECTSITSLPVLSAFLLGLVVRKSIFVNLFLHELCESMKAEVESNVQRRLAIVHILHVLADSHASSDQQKSCLLAVQKAIESHPPPQDLSEESPDHIRYTTTSRLLRTCMTKAGMVA